MLQGNRNNKKKNIYTGMLGRGTGDGREILQLQEIAHVGIRVWNLCPLKVVVIKLSEQ